MKKRESAAAQSQMLKRERFLKNLALTCAGIGVSKFRDELNRTLCDLASYLHIDLAALFLFDAESRSLHRSPYNCGQGKRTDFFSFLLGEGASEQGEADQLVAQICDLPEFSICLKDPKHTPLHETLKSNQLGSLYSFELVFRGEKIGVALFAAESLEAEWIEEAQKLSEDLSKLYSALLWRYRIQGGRLQGLKEIVGDTEATFRNVVESLQEVVMCCDADGYIIYGNPATERVAGASWENFAGKRIYEFFHPADPKKLNELKNRQHKRYAERLGGESESYELEVEGKDGETRWLSVSASPLRDPDGEIVGSIGVCTDTSERRELQQQLHWSQKMEAVGRLAGGVAHDFNNLLTVIRGYAHMMLKDFDHKQLHYRRLQAICEASDSACHLTQQLLTLSKRAVFQPKIVDLREVVEDSLGLIEGLVGSDIEVEFERLEALPSVEVDENQIQQILLNLAINARDAIQKSGRVSISASPQYVNKSLATRIGGVSQGEYVVLRLKDTGSGIPADVMEHLFEPFFTTKSHGTGLGLSTVYGIARNHAGGVFVDSEVGKGTTISVYLPVTEITEVELESSPLPFSASGRETILIVEDEKEVRLLLVEIFQEAGYRVAEAGDGLEALGCLKREADDINLVLSDVSMPNLDGIGLLEAMRQDFPNLPIMLMSGCVSEGDVSGKGMTLDFIAKPFSPPELLEKVRKKLDHFPLSQPKRKRANQ